MALQRLPHRTTEAARRPPPTRPALSSAPCSRALYVCKLIPRGGSPGRERREHDQTVTVTMPVAMAVAVAPQPFLPTARPALLTRSPPRGKQRTRRLGAPPPPSHAPRSSPLQRPPSGHQASGTPSHAPTPCLRSLLAHLGHPEAASQGAPTSSVNPWGLGEFRFLESSGS